MAYTSADFTMKGAVIQVQLDGSGVVTSVAIEGRGAPKVFDRAVMSTGGLQIKPESLGLDPLKLQKAMSFLLGKLADQSNTTNTAQELPAL